MSAISAVAPSVSDTKTRDPLKIAVRPPHASSWAWSKVCDWSASPRMVTLPSPSSKVPNASCSHCAPGISTTASSLLVSGANRSPIASGASWAGTTARGTGAGSARAGPTPAAAASSAPARAVPVDFLAYTGIVPSP